MDLSQFAVWELDPVAFRFSGRAIRYYSVFYFLAMLFGYLTFHHQMRRGGHGLIPTSRFALWMFVGIMVGGRLGHCLFYEPEFYLSHPLQILDLTRGGVSSHGATIAILVTLFLYAKRYGYTFYEIADRFAIGCMIGAAMIRLGNFFNSEIVGREWYGPWALRFPRYAEFIQNQWERGVGSTPGHGSLGWVARALPRHPVQLYEALGIFCVVLVLWIVDRRYGEDRPRGLLLGIFCTLYFGVRFIVEYFKEYLRFATLSPDGAELVIRTLPSAGLTMGQQLSLPFIGLGLWFWIRALRMREPAAVLSRFDRESADE